MIFWQLYWISVPELDCKSCLKVVDSEKAKVNLKHAFVEDTNFFPFLTFFLCFFSSLLKSAEFTEMCPRGKGYVPTGESSYDIDGENYQGQN